VVTWLEIADIRFRHGIREINIFEDCPRLRVEHFHQSVSDFELFENSTEPVDVSLSSLET
jgi:hypothetical protein